MIRKTLKWTLIAGGVTVASGVLLFGTDAFSYLHSSVNRVREAASESVPLEFELGRAHDLIGEIMPEMQANVALIAREEVEIEQLQDEIGRSEQALADQRTRLVKLRNMLDGAQTSFTIQQAVYSRDQVAEDLARSFERMKEAEVVLEGKRRLLGTRQQNLAAAIQTLEKTRHRKAMLEDRVAALEGQYRLVKAAGVESPIHLDGSSLAQAEKLLKQIKTRLDVSERVLAHQARFVESIPLNEQVDEQELLAQVDAFLSPTPVTAEAPSVPGSADALADQSAR